MRLIRGGASPASGKTKPKHKYLQVWDGRRQELSCPHLQQLKCQHPGTEQAIGESTPIHPRKVGGKHSPLCGGQTLRL